MHPHRTEDAGESFSVLEQEVWRKLFDEWLVAEADADVERVLRVGKPARLTIHNFICAIDHQLRAACSFGLERFLQLETRAERLAVLGAANLALFKPPWPMLALIVDQGGDGWGSFSTWFTRKASAWR